MKHANQVAQGQIEAHVCQEAAAPAPAPSGAQLAASLIMEMIGVFALCYVGGWAVLTTIPGPIDPAMIQNAALSGNGPFVAPSAGGSLTSVAIAHGVVLAFIIMVGAPVSGGQFNPAVTVPLIALGELNAVKGAVNIVGQLIGSVLAGVAIRFMRKNLQKDDAAYNRFMDNLSGYPSLNKHMNDQVWKGFFLEMIAVTMLCYAVMGGIKNGYCSVAIGASVGMVLCFSILSIGNFTGASLNPFRTLGPALFEEDFFRKGWWIYYTAPFVGGFIGCAIAKFATHSK